MQVLMEGGRWRQILWSWSYKQLWPNAGAQNHTAILCKGHKHPYLLRQQNEVVVMDTTLWMSKPKCTLQIDGFYGI